MNAALNKLLKASWKPVIKGGKITFTVDPHGVHTFLRNGKVQMICGPQMAGIIRSFKGK